ncbi:DUF2730 family protein [Metarhizobium album]|nr:DUF2730 family protein [Rhizobium album]
MLAIIPWVSGAISIITLLTLVKNMLSSGEKALAERVSKSEQEANARLAKVEQKAIEYDRRIQAIESDMKHLPDRDAVHQLQVTMERIGGRLDTMDERLKPIAATNHRLQEFLLEQAQK